MPNDPSQPSWKGQDRSALPTGRQGRVNPQHTWKTSGTSSTPVVPGRKLKVSLLSGLGVVLLIGLVVLILMLMRTRPTCLVVVATDFRKTADNLSVPLNIYGYRGGRDLLNFVSAADRPGWCDVLGSPQDPWQVDPNRPDTKWWLDLGGRAENTLIIFIAQPGTTDDNGLPELITETGRRWKVEALLAELEKLPRDKKKLLIFDATQTFTDWRRGVLHNHFADGLLQIKDKIAAVPNLLVMCSSSKDQRSWVSEEFGHSVFTHYILDGLAGGAARGKKRGGVYAADLFEHVKTKTDEWVQRNRADLGRPFHQTPMLLPDTNEAKAMANGFLLGYGDGDYAGEPKVNKQREFNEKQLEDAWKARDALAGKTPAPWVSTPRLWRRYCELLLRYEAMARAGEDTAAGQLFGTISALADRIDKARTALGANALSASLAMPAALGYDRNYTKSELSGVAARKNEEVNLGIQALGGNETVARVKYLDYLLTRLSEAPGELTELAAKMAAADSGGKHRPTEAHLAIMLSRYQLPGWEKPSNELLTQVLTVRILAEKTALSVGLGDGYPYSERLARELKNELDLADQDRRLGEDLLFSDAKDNHGKAAEYLKKARNRYEYVRKYAAPVREALAVRDQTFAELPWLTDWVAIARPEKPTRDDVEALWAEAHRLADRLALLDPLDATDRQAIPLIEAPKDDPKGRDLAKQAEIVREGLDALRSVFFTQNVDKEVKSDAKRQSSRQQIEYLLAVPIIKSEDRVVLVKRVREYSFKLASENSPRIEGNELKESVLAENQPRLARAVIGDKLFDYLQDTSYLQPGDKLREITDVKRLGGQLHGHWKKLIAEPDKSNAGDTAKTAIPLPWRERMALVGGTATAPQIEPAELARDERWRNTFQDLARRVQIDHWYDENNQPEFKRLATLYYDAINDTASTAANGPLEANRKLGLLIVDPPKEHTLTTETNYKSLFSVHKLAGSLQPGYATIAPLLNVDNVMRFKSPPKPTPVSLVDDSQQPIELTAVKPLDNFPNQPKLALKLAVYYRGQIRNDVVASLPVNPVPNLTIDRPPVVPGAVVGASADESDGAIAIIFDCSGSMTKEWRDGKVVEVNVKFPAAKDALQKLQTEIPHGAKVSLWTYGPDGIKQQLEPFKWDREDPTKRNLLHDKVINLKSGGPTPLIETMKRAVDRDFKGHSGSKTLLILTDGKDEEDPDNPQDDAVIARRFQKEFVNNEERKDVAIRMVLFKVGQGADAESASAQIQFADLKSRRNPLYGFYEATDEKMLYEQLKDSIRPQITIYHQNQPVFKFHASQAPQSLSWHPEPPLKQTGDFEAEVFGYRQKIVLHDGDRLPLHVKRSGLGYSIGRLLLADFPDRYQLRPLDGISSSKPYTLSLFNQRMDESGATIKGRFTLEDTRFTVAKSGGTIRVDRPKFTWWELRPVGTASIRPQTFVTELSGTPAPMWELMCKDWLTTGIEFARPAVEVWATSSDPPIADVHEVKNFKPGTWVHSNSAQLESLGFEDFDIAIDSAGSRLKGQGLVVRVLSPKGGRYFAEVVGEKPTRELHRYFFDTNHYTAVFWLPEQAKDSPIQIRLISVEAVKADTPRTSKLFREILEK